MQDFDISKAEVAKFLSNLNVTKAAVPDAIRPIVLKELSQVVAPVITVIFQTSLDSGTVPIDWKKAQVCPVFKKGNKTQTDISHLYLMQNYAAYYSLLVNKTLQPG